MCLYPKKALPKIAKKDIVCYKIVTAVTKNEYRSLYTNFKYETYSSYKIFILFTILSLLKEYIICSYKTIKTMFKQKNIYYIRYLFTAIFLEINNSFFHAYMPESTVKEWNNRKLLAPFYYVLHREEDTKNYKCIKCIIPKGSLYFVSEGNDEICSNKIKTLNVLSKEQINNL